MVITVAEESIIEGNRKLMIALGDVTLEREKVQIAQSMIDMGIKRKDP